MKFAFVAALTTAFVPAALAAEPLVSIQLRTQSGLMKYDQSSVRVKPGQSVEITLENTDQLPHNLVILKEEGVFMEVAQKAWELGEKGPLKQWIPEDPRVLAHTPMIDPGQSGKVTFTAPDTEGVLDFVCTFPGHAMIMNGRILVSRAPAPALSGLTCMVFKGAWDKLPDFLALPQENKVSVDEVNDNLITLGVTPLRDQFGLVFNGGLEIPVDGEYVFHLGSDDGSRLVIDDQEVIRHDGVHPYSEKRKKVKLAAGLRRVRVEYFESGGEEALTLAWSGPGFDRVWLSKDERPPGEEFPEAILAAADGRPVMYRGFLSPSGGSRRLIAVGTPEQLHYAFDQDQLRLALLWKGLFLDAGRHWVGRGAGDISPLGFAVVERPAGEEFAVLASPDQPWPALDPRGRATRLRYRGYALDAAGAPTFRYTLDGVEIDDAIRPAGRLAEASDLLVRTLSLRAAPAGGTVYFRLGASADAAPGAGGFWRIGGSLQVKVEGGAAPVSSHGQLLVPVTFDQGQARLQISYRWL